MPTFVGDALADCRQTHRCFNHEHAHELMEHRISCANIRSWRREGVYTSEIIPADCFSLGIVTQSRVDVFLSNRVERRSLAGRFRNALYNSHER